MKSTVAETGDKIGNKIDCRRYGRLCADTVDCVADTVDIVADTVDFVASVYGTKATPSRSTLSTFYKVDRVGSASAMADVYYQSKGVISMTAKLHFKVSTTDIVAQPLCDS